MGEAESTTRCSAAEPLLKAAKDKHCPFCGQAFTSSSLGRHLDLYIRSKNPKAADGLHVVDEIRKLRGGITRRQAKGSVSTPRRDDSGISTPANRRDGVASGESSMLLDSPPQGDDSSDDDGGNNHHHASSFDAEESRLDVRKTRRPFKDASSAPRSRQPSRPGTTTPHVRREASRLVQKADLDQRLKTSEEAEIASATEMALRELLKSVREANAKAAGSALFDFDPYTLTFPSLCLHMLPAPSTLFAPTPFPTAESWSITPPSQKEYEALNKQVRERLLAAQRQRQINQAYPSGTQSTASSAANSPLPTPPLFDPDPQKLFCHMADAFHHWTQQTDKTRHEHWQVEILRCYARADNRRREAEVQLENARREIDYLKASRLTSGVPHALPISINLGVDTAKELGKYGMEHRNWDYERLIEKWRATMRETKAAASGMAAQRPLPGGQASMRSYSVASIPPQSFITAQHPRAGSPIKMEGTAPFTTPPTVDGDLGSDQVDAEGDDDDDDIHLTPQTVSDEGPLNQIQHQIQPQPTLHQQRQLRGMPLQQPTPPHPSQQLQSHMQTALHMNQAQHAQAQAQAQAQAIAHAHAQAQAWATARQRMNTSRNQEFRPHQHQNQQMSPHAQHLGSANSSRRPSLAMMDPHAMNANAVTGLNGSMPTGMEGLDSHQDQFLRSDMGLPMAFVGSSNGAVSMGT